MDLYKLYFKKKNIDPIKKIINLPFSKLIFVLAKYLAVASAY